MLEIFLRRTIKIHRIQIHLLGKNLKMQGGSSYLYCIDRRRLTQISGYIEVDINFSYLLVLDVSASHQNLDQIEIASGVSLLF